MSPSSSRSRFFEKLEWSQTASSIPSPTNQRNSRSNSSRSINWRSERIEKKACNSIARSSFSGLFGSSWGYAVHSNHTHAWHSAILNLPAVHYRLKTVMIECADWRDVLSRFNGSGYLAYCDPPYVPGTRKAGGYAHELTVRDHQDLVETLLKYDGAVVLSGYTSDIYRPLLDAGWDYLAIDVVSSAAGRTRASGLQGEGKCKQYQRRTEGIWRNPEAMRRIAAL